jgi:hypothetical protein
MQHTELHRKQEHRPEIPTGAVSTASTNPAEKPISAWAILNSPPARIHPKIMAHNRRSAIGADFYNGPRAPTCAHERTFDSLLANGSSHG